MTMSNNQHSDIKNASCFIFFCEYFERARFLFCMKHAHVTSATKLLNLKKNVLKLCLKKT